MMQHLHRGQLLIGQARFEQAIGELRLHLADEPNSSFAHALLGLCLVELKQYQEATAEAQQAVHLAPDFPFAHYALAKVWFDRRRFKEALAAIQEAVRLDPHDADYFAILSQIHFAESRWQAALEAADEGLAVDPEHSACTNLRAMSLVKLGRKAQAGATIDAALARNPENALTHANQGWTLLEQRQPVKAMEHFREALRLDPELEWARQGIVEAMKAKNVVYRAMLGYFLWMAKLPPRVQWGVIIGGYFGMQLLDGFGRNHPDLAPWLLPVKIAYLAFAIMTWVADPLFNLLLRLNRFGRLALSREQIVASNWFGGCVFLALASLGVYLATDDPAASWAAFAFGLLSLPVAVIFRCHRGRPRLLMSLYTLGMATLVLGGLAPLLFASLAPDARLPQVVLDAAVAVMNFCMQAFIWAAIGSLWLGNILAGSRPKY
ncbi:MAG TPA: tetratricopeptide repeat protein [Pirellulales bacterium]|nr:tetratricopeptide repeat protein [Pirellulales bacterium]